ncbi:apolipoprotein C-I [Pelodytes ibericus]
MKLLLAVSVIVIALSVLAEPTSAQSPSPPTFKDRVDNFGSSIGDMATKFGEKAKTVLKDIHNSEILTKTRNWFTDTYQNLKQKLKTSD